jgi:outer membrane lipoprotein SlyB
MGSNSPFRTRSAVGSGLLGTVVATGIGAAAGTMVGSALASQSESEPTEAETPEAEADFGETDLVDFGGFGDF